jgi:hypothetical protein
MQKKIEAGRRVAARLLPGEDSLDQTLAAVTELEAAIVEAQGQVRVAPATYEAILSEVRATQAALKAARRNMRRVHVNVLRIRADERMEEEEFGCTRVCLEQSQPATVAQLHRAA